MSIQNEHLQKIIQLLQSTEENQIQAVQLLSSLISTEELRLEIQNQFSYSKGKLLYEGKDSSEPITFSISLLTIAEMLSNHILSWKNRDTFQFIAPNLDELTAIVPHITHAKKIQILRWPSMYRRWSVKSSNLNTLPMELASCTQLEELYVQDFYDIKIIPDVIGHIRSLKKLSFKGCDIHRIPPFLLELPSLATLVLNGNYSLRYIPHQLYNKESLEKIYIKSTGLTNLNYSQFTIPTNPKTKVYWNPTARKEFPSRSLYPKLSFAFQRFIIEKKIQDQAEK